MEKPTELELIYAEAINAANKVLSDKGVNDKLVAELGFISAEAVKSANSAAEVAIIETYKCGCWDCASPGCYGGPCCCWGPACRQP